MSDTQRVPETLSVTGDSSQELASMLAATTAEVRRHGALLDRLRALVEPSECGQGQVDTESLSIIAMSDESFGTELAALREWVCRVILPVYGQEISSARPWCNQWQEHREAVARLHALWLAWKQLTGPEGGLTGPSVWHRDHLDPALLRLRASDGPFAACTTSADRPRHRVLPTPGSGCGGPTNSPSYDR